MGNIVFNVAKGRVGELFNRVDTNDPANSVIVVVALLSTGLVSDATMKDYATLSDVLAGASDEATNSGYARKVLTDSDITTYSVDNSGDKLTVTLSDQTWTAVAASPGAWGKLLICYDSDSTGGTDANIVPLTAHDFTVTPDGNDITADFGTTVYEAS